MIVYCGLRHFYVLNFLRLHAAEAQGDAYYILTHQGQVWDFSPELKDYHFNPQKSGRAVLQLDKPVLTIPISLPDFLPLAQKWHRFSRQYTEELEIEHPHSWYLRFKQPAILQQFLLDLSAKLKEDQGGGIWGAGESKLVAKLAAHNLKGPERIVPSEQTGRFLNSIPLHRLPLEEATALEKLGFKTLGELGAIPLVELSSQFGDRAEVLQRLGRGEDLVPFQPEQILEQTWFLDCTSLEGFLRPLERWELQPYLKQGMEELASALAAKQQVAGELEVEAHPAQGTVIKKSRAFKEAAADPKQFLRTVENLLPQGPLAQIKVVVRQLAPAPLAQLAMFWEPPGVTLSEQELLELGQLGTQVGIELPRRERLLSLWEEYFS